MRYYHYVPVPVCVPACVCGLFFLLHLSIIMASEHSAALRSFRPVRGIVMNFYEKIYHNKVGESKETNREYTKSINLMPIGLAAIFDSLCGNRWK